VRAVKRESCRLDDKDAESKLLSRSRLFLGFAGIGAEAKPTISKLHVGAPNRDSREEIPDKQDDVVS